MRTDTPAATSEAIGTARGDRQDRATDVPAGLGALAWHAAVVAAKAWRRWRRGGLLPFLRGRLAALAELPRLLRHRRALHRLGASRPGPGWEMDYRYRGETAVAPLQPA